MKRIFIWCAVTSFLNFLIQPLVSQRDELVRFSEERDGLTIDVIFTGNWVGDKLSFYTWRARYGSPYDLLIVVEDAAKSAKIIEITNVKLNNTQAYALSDYEYKEISGLHYFSYKSIALPTHDIAIEVEVKKCSQDNCVVTSVIGSAKFRRFKEWDSATFFGKYQ